MYFSCIDLIKRPKIYNDRRIFHPNINIETLEILYPELVLGWNPAKKYLFDDIFKIRKPDEKFEVHSD